MSDERRLHYLAALGVPVWRLRSSDAGESAQTADTTTHAPDEIAIEMPVVQRREEHAAEAVPTGIIEEAAAATMDWPTLAGAVARCEKCGLHRSRTRTVFGTGARDADWMLIGEAPGAEEDRKGEPFVGRAGQLLDAMLAATGHSRESVFIANILKCRPPGNRDPESEEADRCEPWLKRQIELLRPRLIIALGRISAQRLLGNTMPLGRLRGRPHELQIAKRTIPLVVTYHPAYLLRSPAQKAKSWEDLRLAMRISADTGA